MTSVDNIRSKWFKGILIFAFLFLIAFIFMLYCPNSILTHGLSKIDSSVFQYVTREILYNDKILYKDTFDHKGPMMYVYNVLGMLLSPNLGLWVVELLSFTVSLILMFFIARLWCGNVGSLLTVLVCVASLVPFFDAGNYTQEYAMPYILGSLYIFLEYFIKSHYTKLRLVVCGACFGAVVLLCANLVALWCVMCLGVLIKCIVEKRTGELWGFILYFLLGFSLVFIPFVIWYAINGALRDFIEKYFLFNMLYATDPVRASWFARLKSVITFVKWPAITVGLTISVFACLRSKKFLDTVLLGYFVLALLFQTISGQTYIHYGIALIPALICPFAWAVKQIEDSMKGGRNAGAVIALLLVLELFSSEWFGIIENSLDAIHTRHNYPTTKEGVIGDVVHSNTTEGDKIIVCGNWNVIYNLSNRFSASKYSYQEPVCRINPTMEDEFFADLEREIPAIVVLPDDFYAHERMSAFLIGNSYEKIEVAHLTDCSIYKLS